MQTRCMRTKSAGVLGASPKLLPLYPDSPAGSELKTGGVGIAAVAGGLSSFGSSPTTRIIALGPTLPVVESSAGSVSADPGAIVGAVAATTISASRPQPARPDSPSLLFPGTTLGSLNEGRGSGGSGGGGRPISGAPGAGGGSGGKRSGLIKHLSSNFGVGSTDKPKIACRFPAGDGEHVPTHAPSVTAAIAASAAAGSAADVITLPVSSAVAYSIADPAWPKHRSGSICSPLAIRPLHRASRIGYQPLRPIKKNEGSVLDMLPVGRAPGLRDGVAAAVRADHRTNTDLAMGIGVAEGSATSSLVAGGERTGDSDSSLFPGSSNTFSFNTGVY